MEVMATMRDMVLKKNLRMKIMMKMKVVMDRRKMMAIQVDPMIMMEVLAKAKVKVEIPMKDRLTGLMEKGTVRKRKMKKVGTRVLWMGMR